MKVVIIAILVIIYFSFGTIIAAVEESDNYDKTGEYGLNSLICIFWPIFLLYKWVKGLIEKIKEKNENSN